MDEEADLEPGTIFGGYQVLQLVGVGGMGRVYRARHRTLERDVALKVMAPRVLASPAFADRFLREARAAARLNHPSIVQIYDVGDEDGRYYLVLEYVEGRSLGSLLRERGAFPVTEAVALARQAALALAVAHEAGIVHRDIKPDNMLLTARGELKLVDLGLAKRVDIVTDFATETGAFTGTPHYMAPEQIRGARDVDGRADIYALGATLFHMVCGRTPCSDGWGGAVLAAHLEGRIDDPAAVCPGLPPELCALIRRMLARDRDERHAGAREVERDLARVAALHGSEQSTLALELAVAAIRPPSGPGISPDALGQLEQLLVSDLGPVARVLLRQTAHGSGDGDELCRRLAGHYTEPGMRERFLARSRALIASSPTGGHRRPDSHPHSNPHPFTPARAASEPAPGSPRPWEPRLPAEPPRPSEPPRLSGSARPSEPPHPSGSPRPSEPSRPSGSPRPARSPLPFAPNTGAAASTTPRKEVGARTSHDPSPPDPGFAFEPQDLADLELRLAEIVGPVARVLVRRAAASRSTWAGLVETLAAEIPAGDERRRFVARCSTQARRSR